MSQVDRRVLSRRVFLTAVAVALTAGATKLVELRQNNPVILPPQEQENKPIITPAELIEGNTQSGFLQNLGNIFEKMRAAGAITPDTEQIRPNDFVSIKRAVFSSPKNPSIGYQVARGEYKGTDYQNFTIMYGRVANTSVAEGSNIMADRYRFIAGHLTDSFRQQIYTYPFGVRETNYNLNPELEWSNLSKDLVRDFNGFVKSVRHT